MAERGARADLDPMLMTKSGVEEGRALIPPRDQAAAVDQVTGRCLTPWMKFDRSLAGGSAA